MKKLSIYTDGSCSGNPGPGGWGAVMKCNDQIKEISGFEDETTNNRMELMAAIQALKQIKHQYKIDLTTDSQYLQLGMTQWLKNWKQNAWRTAAKKAVKNIDLWQQLDTLNQQYDIEWHWIKSHDGHPDNERADYLARQEMEQRLGLRPRGKQS